MSKGIVFLGTGKELFFAIKKMHDHGLVLACGCQDNTLVDFAEIAEFCYENQISIITSIEEAVALNPKFVFMISYPKLIPLAFLNECKFINMHGALIPRFRGIHGGTWAIINGEEDQGYSIHRVDEGIDSGPVYHQGVIKVDLNENVNQIRERILKLFSMEIETLLQNIYNDKIGSIPQDENESIYVCKRKSEDGLINWNRKSLEIHNLVRALTPPYTDGAFTYYKGEKLFLLSTEFLVRPSYIGVNGQVVAKYPNRGVLIKTGDSVILVKTILYRGKELKAVDLFKTVGARCGLA